MSIVLGITGGIATGKSTVDAFLREKQLPIVDSDAIAHQLLAPGAAGWVNVKTTFGEKFLNADQTIGRAALGRYVFTNPEALAQLNMLNHPLIYAEIKRQIAAYRQQGAALIVFDAPLMYETGGEKLCDYVLVVTTTSALQLKRLMTRNQISRRAALARIHSQLPLAVKIAKADFVINNVGSKAELRRKLDQVIASIESEG
ncbi:MAG: dephospho-CoA kinase [Lactobacillus sp.]|nr:dephospho-CoA kinase [Lactobacillus sp.]MDN6042776.1 dephospho-CoA kinase [Lactobacillus sp.]MDN6051970.1 dephospho-CoA kinase [Lactobacillus sp.]